MKKIVALLVTFAMVMSMTVAFATTYENAAFIGSWIARGEDGNINARLYVDFCDSERVKCRFETYNKEGQSERLYEIYQTPINDTKAKGTFSTEKSINNWFPTGVCELELTADRIKFSIDANNGVRIYSGIFSPESTEFNSQVSPYNTNVHISLNNVPIGIELSPFILKHRTFVPLRGVFEAMGINVEWFDTKEGEIHTHEIRATRGDYTVSISRQNKNEMGFGSWKLQKKVLDEINIIDLSEVQPVIINDHTFVPLRVIVESFDTKIDWIDAERRVEITDETVAEEEVNVGAQLYPEGEEPPKVESTDETPEENEPEDVTDETPAESEPEEVPTEDTDAEATPDENTDAETEDVPTDEDENSAPEESTENDENSSLEDTTEDESDQDGVEDGTME